MINAVHAVIHTRDAEAVRAFFRDVLGFTSVDAGGICKGRAGLSLETLSSSSGLA